MVSIDGGLKVYQGVDVVGGRPMPSGWKRGRVVQRPHAVRETAEGVFVVRFRHFIFLLGAKLLI